MEHTRARHHPSNWLTLALQSAPMNATPKGGPDPASVERPTQAQLREFADHITAARLNAGLTQLQLAEATGLGRRTITRVENAGSTTALTRRVVGDFFAPRAVPEDPDTAADTGDARDARDAAVDLTRISSIALLAELARRVGVAEHRIGAAWPGPPVRAWWLTADGPTQTGTPDQQRGIGGHTEEA